MLQCNSLVGYDVNNSAVYEELRINNISAIREE